jgi:SPP1 family phage portal protein
MTLELEQARVLFAQLDIQGNALNKDYEISMRYYKNETDYSLEKDDISKIADPAEDNELRRYDARVPNNFHQLLVDQKTNYMASIPPVIDTGKDKLNELLIDRLGDKYDNVFLNLATDASNAGVSWVQVWKDDKTARIKYAVIPPDQITPIYNNSVEREIMAVRRSYNNLNEDGKVYRYYEYWTADEVAYFKREASATYAEMVLDNRVNYMYDTIMGTSQSSNVYKHGFGRVPFVEFPNNMIKMPDLRKYKGLIDVYDKVYNGFINDIVDVQQVILVLTNYGGQDLDEMWDELKRKKAIKVDNFSGQDRSGVDKLTIDIPVEARNSLLEQTLDLIFLHGQGVNPTKLELGNNSGVALKMLYSLLELKSAAMEAQFRPAVADFVGLLLADMIDKNNLEITQTWRRNSINNNVESADLIAKLADVTSKQNIAKNNPLVEDWQEELELQEEQSMTDQFELDNTEQE